MKRILHVAVFAFRELVRSKLLYIWFVSVTVMAFLAYFLSQLSFGDEVRIFSDLGLVAMEFTGYLVLFLGLAVTYTTEMDQKAIYLQLSKPVTRGEYLLGRILGLFAVNAMVVAGMGVTVAFLTLDRGSLPPLFWESTLLILLEMFLLTSLGLALQMIATTMVAVVLYTLGAVVLGHFTGEILWILQTQLSTLGKWGLHAAYYCFPNLEVFNLKDRLYEPGIGIGWSQWQDILLYTFAYSFGAFLVGWINLEKREFR
jgi:ABC-type transport system involved in multi-copper enzyme maturation permease subunit